MVSVGAVFGLAEHHLDRLDATVRTMDQRMARVKGMRAMETALGRTRIEAGAGTSRAAA